MDEATYIYRINSIHLKNGEPFAPGRINVFIGANNCGKTQLLKDMLAYITGTRAPTVILNELEIPYPETWDAIEHSSRVLEGMFYKGVVATEADADAVFYQRLFQKIGAADEVHFVNAHNKQTLKKIIGPYKKLGIKFAMIADADVIRDKREFSDILQVISDEQLKSRILQERDAIMNYFQTQNKYEALCELQAKTKELAEQTTIPETAEPDDIARTLFDFRLNLKKLRDESDELSEFKKNGRASLPIDLQANFDTLWECCASVGLFVVNVGELESWMIDYDIERTSNKSKWISRALSKLFEIEYDESKSVWKFVDALRTYLVS